jgi:hypothetical protein
MYVIYEGKKIKYEYVKLVVWIEIMYDVWQMYKMMKASRAVPSA